MVVLVYLLCAVFILLIINHMVNYLNYPIKEGFGNPAAMMKMHHKLITNDVAVKVLTKRVDKIEQDIKDLKGHAQSNADSITDMVEARQLGDEQLESISADASEE